MKAWLVNEKGEFCSLVVYAKTRGRAKSIAFETDVFEDTEYIDLVATRYPVADKYYNGDKEKVLDWDDDNDRIFLVKDCGWYCDEYTVDDIACSDCVARHYCKGALKSIYEEKRIYENH